ncbi:MAG: Mrp/NBP35 family ATP-binding protein [Candidatus Omnitrophica bacterium]|nr:Mrp/NBP35 family ATP-binding protein [Candidatus Omnitrophota bacterium]
MTTLSKEKIIESIRVVKDPDLQRDIVSLGMVKEVEIEGGKVSVHVELTTPACPLKDKIKQDVQNVVSALEGVKEVAVQMTSQVRRGPSLLLQQGTPSGIKNVIAVASGKGGVGKSTVCVNLAVALAQTGASVGLLDGDIYGPNVPLMLGIPAGSKPGVSSNEKMIPLQAYGLKVISMGLLVPPDAPMIWRGPMLHSAVTQFLQKVDWGELDYLLVDLPPGTGDVQLSLVQTVSVTGAVIVTTPQEVALMDVRKGIAMFQKTNVPILGIVENMSSFICPHCNKETAIFSQGGGRETSEKLKVPYLGDIPIDPRVREGGDQGKPIVTSYPDSPAAKQFTAVAGTLAQQVSIVDILGGNR